MNSYLAKEMFQIGAEALRMQGDAFRGEPTLPLANHLRHCDELSEIQTEGKASPNIIPNPHE